MALVRLSLARHRLSLFAIGGLTAGGVISAHLIASFGGPLAVKFAITALWLTMVPTGFWSMMLFLSESDRNLFDRESGYNHWLLRMPIADWKLALVPVTLKTIWLSALWMVFALTIGSLAIGAVPLVGPAIILSAIGVWLMVFTWRPFAHGWWRLAAMMTGIFAIWLCAVCILDSDIKLPEALRHWILLASYAAYPLGAWMSVRAVRLSRSSSLGLIAETAKASRGGEPTEIPVRHHTSPRMALLWNDVNKSRHLMRRCITLGVIPGMIFVVSFVPLSIPGYIGTMVLLTCFGWSISSLVLDRTDRGVIVLPPYLAASPLSTAELAWTRLFTFIGMLLGWLLLAPLAFAGWAIWAENREIWNQWSAQMAQQTGASTAGGGIAAAMFLATCVIVVGRGAANIWPALCGRSWIQFTVAVVCSLAYMLPIGVVIAWFLQQDSWQGARQSGLYWLTYLPAIVVTWLVLKVIAVGVAIAQLRSRALASWRAIGSIVVGWSALTILIAWALHLLIPHPAATLLWCFAAVATSLPLARVLIVPVSLHFGRHQ
jgi:hypothetical protein